MSNNDAWKAFGYQGSNIELWNLKPSASPIVLVGHEAGLNVLVFSSDSKLLASGAEDGTVRIWRVGENAQHYTRTDLLLLAGEGQLAFSPGQWNEEWRLRLRNPDPALWHGFRELVIIATIAVRHLSCVYTLLCQTEDRKVDSNSRS